MILANENSFVINTFRVLNKRLDKLIIFIQNNKIIFLLVANVLILLIGIILGYGILTFLLAIAFSLFIFKPYLMFYFLSVFIPLKALIRSELIGESGFLSLVIPICLLGSFLGFKIYERSKDKKSETDVFFLLLFITGLFSTLVNGFINQFRPAQMLDFFVWLQLFGFYLVGKCWPKEKKAKKSLLVFNIIIINLVSIFSVFTYFLSNLGSKYIESYELITNRAVGSMANPNALSGYLLVGSIFIGMQFIKKDRLLDWLYFFLPVVAIMLSFSRGAIIILFVIMVLYLIKEGHIKFLPYIFLGSIIFFLLLPQSYQLRLINIGSKDHISFSLDSGRLWAAENVFYINQKHFLYGNGWGSYGGEYSYNPPSPTYLEGVQGGTIGVANTDNQWLQIYAQQGLVGLWLYVLMFYYLLRGKIFKEKISYAVVSFLLLSFFIDTFQFYQIAFWGFLAVGIMAASNKLQLKQPS